MNFIELLLLILPAYASNGAPVVFGGGRPIDFGLAFVDGKRLFGNSKTLRGFVSGLIVGTILGTFVAVSVSFLPWLSFQDKIALAFFTSLGAMAGDLMGSFIKRRLGLQPGSQYFLLDQLLFVITALLFAIAYAPRILFELNGWDAFALLVLTYFLHLSFNWLAHKLKLKNVPW